jgi:hypothetical protein
MTLSLSRRLVICALPVVVYLCFVFAMHLREARITGELRSRMLRQMKNFQECISAFEREHQTLPQSLDVIEGCLTNRMGMRLQKITNTYVYLGPGERRDLNTPTVLQKLDRKTSTDAYALERSGAIVLLNESQGSYSRYLERARISRELREELLK